MSGRPQMRTADSLAFSAGSDNAWKVNFAGSKVFESPVISGESAGTDSETVARRSIPRNGECDSCLRTGRVFSHQPNPRAPLTTEWLCRRCLLAAQQIRAAKDALQSSSAEPQQAQGDLHVVDVLSEQGRTVGSRG